ncbi:MAG: hypothetical protein KBH86_11210 [Syntrophorhabdus sp.]|nr:hypothetical protein [Syntrophorhabdus sp.]
MEKFFVEHLKGIQLGGMKTIGLNWNYRFETPGGIGSALVIMDSPNHPCTEAKRIQGDISVDNVIVVYRDSLLVYPRYHYTGYAINRIKQNITLLFNRATLCHT